MKMGGNVVEFEAYKVPIIGNLNNGYLIGLTPEGKKVCHKLINTGATQEEITSVDERLYEHLIRGQFFENTEPLCTTFTAYLHVTQRCNLHCTGCYSYDNTRNHAVDLNFDEILSCLSYLHKNGVRRLIISGGEPFLREDLSAITRRAKQQFQFDTIEILTNGTLVSAEILDALANYVDRISVSFDGVSEHDSAHIREEQRFNQLIETIRQIKESGIQAHILPTIHSLNIDKIDEYKALAKDLGATISFSLFSPVGESSSIDSITPSDQDLARLGVAMITSSDKEQTILDDTPVNANLAITAGCGAGCAQLSISADGRVFPCHMLHCDDLCMDDALSQHEPSPISEHGQFPIKVSEVFECKDCDIRYLCGGGCRARAYRRTGDIRAKDPYCALMKAFYEYMFKQLLANNQERR